MGIVKAQGQRFRNEKDLSGLKFQYNPLLDMSINVWNILLFLESMCTHVNVFPGLEPYPKVVILRSVFLLLNLTMFQGFYRAQI